MKHRLLKLWTGLTVLIVGCSLVLGALPASAAVNYSNLMDDSVFDNSTSMSAGEIDAWLNGNFPSSCISSNNGFASRIPTGYSPGGGFTFGGNGTAGQVIAASAQVYGVNPQVLLATLQKEQSLVSGTAGCSTLRYVGAMGYGCPDSGTTHSYSGLNLYTINGSVATAVSGTCVNSSAKAGFSQQVIRGAWLLKFGQQRSRGNTSWAVITGSWDNSDDPQSCYSGPMTQGSLKRCAGDSPTYFDGYTTIDGVSTHMDTGPTAAFYWYTPHFHGNENFVNLYTGWFGSVYGGAIGSIGYRMYNAVLGDHYWTARENERFYARQYGFRDDGNFKVSATQEPGMIPIYRMYNGRLSDNWLTPDGMNRYWGIVYGGYKDDGVAFYAYPANTGTSGSICAQGQAVFQLWHGGFGDHFYTTNGGDRYWGIVHGGYVDDRSANYNSDWQGSSAFCIPY